MPPGYERLAAEQNLQGTWRLVRRFGKLNQSLIRWHQQAVTSGEAEWNRLCKERQQAVAAEATSSTNATCASAVRDLEDRMAVLADKLSHWRIQLGTVITSQCHRLDIPDTLC